MCGRCWGRVFSSLLKLIWTIKKKLIYFINLFFYQYISCRSSSVVKAWEKLRSRVPFAMKAKFIAFHRRPIVYDFSFQRRKKKIKIKNSSVTCSSFKPKLLGYFTQAHHLFYWSFEFFYFFLIFNIFLILSFNMRFFF
jgi:hypothetical protein